MFKEIEVKTGNGSRFWKWTLQMLICVKYEYVRVHQFNAKSGEMIWIQLPETILQIELNKK